MGGGRKERVKEKRERKGRKGKRKSIRKEKEPRSSSRLDIPLPSLMPVCLVSCLLLSCRHNLWPKACLHPGRQPLARLLKSITCQGHQGQCQKCQREHQTGSQVVQCLYPWDSHLSAWSGRSRNPRDLAADIPQEPRGPNWQGQLQTGAEPALFPGWRPLSIQALLSFCLVLLSPRQRSAGIVGPTP